MSLEDGGGIVTVTVGQGPQDIRHLQKERVALLEQLEDCTSSGEEGSSRRRCKHRRSHSGEGSRPGTPLCDERPENLPPVEPRRTPRERPPDPLSLPLPRFATQLMSPRPAPPSPPASPPRPHSASSDDSEPSPPSPEWEERLRSLDEKYEKWSGSRTIMAKVDPATLRVRHKLLDLDLNELQPSDIVKSVLAKRSVFDEDSKRLENFGEKYEPREFVPTRPGLSTLRPRLDSPVIHSPAAPKSPASASSPAGAKGLQYPFPSHPPVLPTTSVATTTAAISTASSSSISTGILPAPVNTTAESSKSPLTFPTSCISSILSVRQFHTPSSTFHQIPKVSPPSASEKKSENVDPRCMDRTKSSPKLLSPCNSISGVDVAKKETISTTTPIKPLKSCLRRESGEEKTEIDERRRSREEDNRVVVSVKCDFEKGRELDGLERRRSLSDPRRRDSVDSNIDSLRCESVSDKLKDRNHKEDRRRRESVDNIAKRDTELSDVVKSRLSDTQSNEQSDFSDCSKITDIHFTTLRLDDNLRHSQVTDTLEKKKDSLQICPERDRRRVRDNSDSSCSDNFKHRKVPESLDIKKELESDIRQRDNTEDMKDPSINVEPNVRRKDSGQSESSNVSEIFERRNEKDLPTSSQESLRHRERKDSLSTKKEKESLDCLDNSRHKNCLRSPDASNNQRHKDDRFKHYSHTENSRHRDNCVRKESDSSDENPMKIFDCKKEADTHHKNKHIDNILHKKDQISSDSINSSSKVENFQEHYHLKEVKRDCELIDGLRYRENSKHDHTRQRDSDKRKENINESYNNCSNDYKKEDHYNAIKGKHGDHGNSDNTNTKHSKHSSLEYSLMKTKEYDRRKDCEKHDPRIKHIISSMDNPKQKHYVKQNVKETVNQISEWVEEIRKDLENSCHAKIRDPFNEVDSVDKKNKISENYLHNEIFKKEDNKVREDFKKEDGLVETERKNICNASESIYFNKISDTAEIFRRKEVSFKKEANDNERTRSKELEKKKENNVIDNCKYKNITDRRKEEHEQDNVKDSDLNDQNNDTKKTNDFLEERQFTTKPICDLNRKSKRENPEKESLESDSNDQKDLEMRINELERHDEEITRKNDFFRKEKKKERVNSWPAAIGGKRRLSSQDFLDICSDESKKSKPERRDSKDSNRSSCSSKKSNCERQNKSFTKLLEDKIKEDKEREINKKRKDDDIPIDNLKMMLKKDRQIVGERKKEDRKGRIRLKENGITASESDAGSGDDDKTPKKHSIFDIVEEPAYISMYDKVKARSTKNMQKQEEEKRQERLKEKFNQLKQSRAKREEKKRSTSYDEDSDSERGGGRRSNKLMTSSEDDIGSENDTRNKSRKIMSDTSEDDVQRLSNSHHIKQMRINTEEIESKPRKILSDTSEDDSLRLSIARIKAARAHQEDGEPKLRKILSDTSEDDLLKHRISRSKPSRLQSDESECELGFENPKKEDDFGKQSNSYISSDLFSNISDDPEHPTQADIEKEQSDKYRRNSIDDSNSDIPRRRSHKKKQKRQKSLDEVDDGSIKRHSSKKDRRKSSHSHDGDEDYSGQSKVRKKKSDRENSSKRDGKMEDIFGPLSDDSDKVPNKWHMSQIYGSDSEDERQIQRKRDKKRKDRKSRELDEAGRALEAKLMDPYDGYQPSGDFSKTKKKKRKKSREEKVNKHYQDRHEEEAAALANEADSERESETVVIAPSLPRLIDSPPSCLNQNKKPDIPGFGSQVDENIHETAVKSISESPTKPIEEKQEVIEETTNNTDDKPTPVISQEETEDAVAALLLEDSFGGGFESYTKPDTPVSEPDLQIDTDTEDTFDPIDFSRPPRTPDIPSSFYRQQDTREGLEERILALACPDTTPNKAEDGNVTIDSSLLQTEDAQLCNKKIKTDDNNKEVTSLNLANTPTCDKVKKVNDNKCDSKKEKISPSNVPVESGKRHDLPPLVCHGENSHTVQPLKGNHLELKSQVASDQCSSKLQVAKVNSDKTSASSSQTNALPPFPQSLPLSSSQLLKNNSIDSQSSISSDSSASNQTESIRSAQGVHPQSNPSVMVSPHIDVNLHKKLRTQPTIHESCLEKSQLSAKPANQIISPTSVALIVQTQSKLSQSSSQNSSILQLSTKLNSSGNQQLDLKGSGAQYVLHHTIQQSQITGSITNRMPSQQTGSPVLGNSGQGNHKLTVPVMPVTPKTPGLFVSTKSPGTSSSVKSPSQPTVQEQQFKQIVLNHPHTQQLSVNVSHNHQLNTNLLLSPNQKVNISHSPIPHNSPTALSFSPHHMKVSLTQQQTNNIHASTMQLSPNPQQISSQHKQILQHSPSAQQSIVQHVTTNQYQNKNSSHLLQPVSNCINSIPVKLCSPPKPGIVHSVSSLPPQNLTPVSQSSQVNKISPPTLQSPGIQPVRAVVLQNPTKQTITLIQPQMVQKPVGVQMIRPLNAPQPQVVHTLKNETPSSEKTKYLTENISKSLSQLSDLHSQPPKVIVSKPCEEPLSLTDLKKEDSQVPADVITSPVEVEQKEEIKNVIAVKPVLEESKQLHAVIQDLTHKAVMAKQSSSSNSQLEEVNCNTAKSGVVDIKDLNDSVNVCESKDTKLEEKTDIQTTNVSGPEAKSEVVVPKLDEKNNHVEDKVELKDESKQNKCNSDVVTKENVTKDVVDAIDSGIGKQVNCQNDDSKADSIEIVQSKTIDEPKVEKIRIKKEDAGLFVEATSGSLSIDKQTVEENSPKTEVKDEEIPIENTIVKMEGVEDSIKNIGKWLFPKFNLILKCFQSYKIFLICLTKSKLNGFNIF